MRMKRIRTIPTVLAIYAIGLVAACGGSPLRPAGTTCSTDGECAAGLSCLSLAMISDAGCTALATTCSKACQVDGDCVAVGPKFKCFASCGATNACGQTM
jgi:hypothetical protein